MKADFVAAVNASQWQLPVSGDAGRPAASAAANTCLHREGITSNTQPGPPADTNRVTADR